MTIRNVVVEQLEWWKAPTSWDHKLRGAYTLQKYTWRHRVQTAPLGNLQEQILDCYSQGFCYFLLASWNHETVNHPLLRLTSTQKKQTCILPEIKGYEETPIWEELSSAPPRLSQGRPLKHIKPPIFEKNVGKLYAHWGAAAWQVMKCWLGLELSIRGRYLETETIPIIYPRSLTCPLKRTYHPRIPKHWKSCLPTSKQPIFARGSLFNFKGCSSLPTF